MRRSRLLVWKKHKERALEQHLRLRAPQTWTVLCASVDQYLRTTRAVNPTPVEIGAVMSTVCLLWQSWTTRKRDVDSAMRSAAIVARLDISVRCADNVKSSLASQVPRTAVARVLAKAARTVEAQTSAIDVDRSVIDDLIALVETRVAASVGKCGHSSQVCRSSGGNANARAVEVQPVEPEEEREIQHVWALSVYDTSGFTLDALSVCDNSDFLSDESGNPVECDHGLWC